MPETKRTLRAILTILASVAMLAGAAAPAWSATLCTLVAEAESGRTVLEEGDCSTRVTPASTFKLPLAVMGFDAGFLKGPHAPLLPYKDGYVAWIDAWKQPADPTRWLTYSVVWYSQQITHALGADRLRRYAEAFGYGNADFSGDPGQDNGLDRAWIASSLTVSPREQVGFLQKLVTGTLPVSGEAMTMTRAIVEIRDGGDGWTIHGKTGGAFPRLPGGGFDRARGWGWYVGWAEKGDDAYVFARLIRDEERHPVSPGLRARDALIADWPEMAAGFPSRSGSGKGSGSD
ncbi:class D beta-lactamase [Amorphus orientalis]|uniref:beta-lactamase n=1 Tax=Amorphus orientalis TaxID=649198 RepID=A0AAE3VM95_9HYPH|nr:class D beta-lactamase [Amorphus orientalis]MDQ0315099.1 beta-lactamase class D [Amorphus orientalis]